MVNTELLRQVGWKSNFPVAIDIQGRPILGRYQITTKARITLYLSIRGTTASLQVFRKDGTLICIGRVYSYALLYLIVTNTEQIALFHKTNVDIFGEK